METKMLKSTFLSLLFTLIITLTTAAFNDYNADKILLSDVKVLTLHQGQMTNARRSPPVPQLKCVGGSAQYKFTPKVVQCYNRGSDGYDIQWECKTDMDNAYRFGHVEVTCEGYDYPNDPYVLKGSCGLEYTIDFTEEGTHREQQKGGYNYQGSYNYNNYKESSGGVGGLFMFGGILFAMYVVYKVCIAPNAQAGGPNTARPTGSTGPSAPGAPPPYGFRPEYMPNQDPPPPYDDYSSQGTQGPAYDHPRASAFPKPGYSHQTHATGGTGGGFWTGAATGGVLGYLFGNRNNYQYGHGYRPRDSWFGNNHHTGGFNSGGGSFFRSSSSSSSSSGSSGTRTASGFGGTSRR